MSVSLITQRVFHETHDISVAVADYRVGTYALNYLAGEHLYIGCSSPFNNLWLELSTVAVASVGAPTIEVWFNSNWSNVVDIIDQTEGLTKSGRISWALDIDKGWNSEQKSVDVGLAGTNIYNRYWLRISWAGDFTAGLGYIGQKFSDDTIMSSHYPDLMQSQILAGYKAGKTNWNEQHFMASEAIIKEIRKRNFILTPGQLLDWTVFEDAACHKVAEIVYQAFGAPYIEHTNNARKRYNEELNTRCFVIDSNMNGHVEVSETIDRQGWLTR